MIYYLYSLPINFYRLVYLVKLSVGSYVFPEYLGTVINSSHTAPRKTMGSYLFTQEHMDKQFPIFWPEGLG